MTELDNLTAPELKALAERAERLADQRAAQDRAAFRNRVLNDIKAAGYTVADILGTADKPAKPEKPRVRAINPNDRRHGPRPPKYRHPDGRTWSGRGAKPEWFRDLLAAGHSPESLLIPVAP